MRTDASFDRKQVHCPNACTLGFGKYKAQFGDIVLFNLQGRQVIGRMAGRIAYAPAIGEDKAPIRNWLLVVALSDRLTHVSEQWVNPQDVTEVYDPTREGLNLLERLTFLLGDAFKKETVDDLRRYAGSGFETPAKYRAYRDSAVSAK